MLEHWINPAALAIVFGGTVAATMLRCGWADTRHALRGLKTLFEPAFDVAKAKGEMAKQIRDIADAGFVRAEPHHFGDQEFDYLADMMISQRSINSLHEEHQKYKEARMIQALRAFRTFESAADLAPILGLAGTLIALGQAPAGAHHAGGLVDAIAMAVVTTLYGLVTANFVFAPLANAIERKSRREEHDREEVLEWLADGLRRVGLRPGESGKDKAAA
ncbi:MAG: MotA/TolQ/ExbB proton channel family protein [Sphingomonadaceae bacterium]